jgi:hypothetical protein
MSIQEYTAVLSGLTSAAKLAKSLIDKVKDKKIRQEVGELQDVLLRLQQDFILLQSKHAELVVESDNRQREIALFVDWESVAANYELKEIAEGVFVYSLKTSTDSGEPSHWICSRCFSNRTKSILQLSKKVMAGHFYVCPECKCEICDHSKRQEFSVSSTPGIVSKLDGYRVK